MSMFTPGPWEVDKTVIGELGIFTKHGPRIAGIDESNRHPPKEVEANARLIAAAPALYEACKAALVFLHDCPEEEALMKSALALADGETK